VPQGGDRPGTHFVFDLQTKMGPISKKYEPPGDLNDLSTLKISVRFTRFADDATVL